MKNNCVELRYCSFLDAIKLLFCEKYVIRWNSDTEDKHKSKGYFRRKFGTAKYQLFFCTLISILAGFIPLLTEKQPCPQNGVSFIGFLIAASYMSYNVLITGRLLNYESCNYGARMEIIRISTLSIIFQLLLVGISFFLQYLQCCDNIRIWIIYFTIAFILTTDINLIIHIFTLAFSKKETGK